jgi:lycopene cyclase domain-containing protein
MTYFNFLLIFLGIPLTILAFLHWLDWRNGKKLPAKLTTWPVWGVIGVHVLVAVLYTTPWDNYLVATKVWWYHPDLVTGWVIGWVPIEEYCFFVLQTLMSGAWLVWLLRRVYPQRAFAPNLALRKWLSAAGIVLWLASTALLLAGYAPATYTTLTLSWALFPILIQLVFGADILWHYRAPIALATLTTTSYLAAADTLAIGAGTWVINPLQSFNIFLPGGLPIEELLFFLVTNLLVTVGCTLVLARASHERAGLRRVQAKSA